MTTTGMKSGKVRMRIDGCIKIIRKRGASSIKDISLALGYSPTWATSYIKKAISNGELICVRLKKPKLYDLPPEQRGLEIHYAKDTTSETFKFILTVDTNLQLKAMAFLNNRTADDELEELILEAAQAIVRERQLSITSVIKEMLRHEKEMARLSKGYR